MGDEARTRGRAELRSIPLPEAGEAREGLGGAARAATLPRVRACARLYGRRERGVSAGVRYVGD